MRHIKTFESYSPEESINEEFMGKFLKTTISSREDIVVLDNI